MDTGNGVRSVALSLANTADLLGTTASDLMQQLSGGTSLSDLADAAGVSHDDLVATVASVLPVRFGSAVDSGAVAEQVADAASSTTVTSAATGPVQQFQIRSGTGTSSVSRSLQHTADLLGTTASGLMNQLSAGHSLTEPARTAGVSHRALVHAVAADLPPGRSAPSTGAVAEQVAEQVADATASTTVGDPAGPGPSSARQQFTVDDGTGPHTVALSLANTADLLGMSTADLMAGLSSGSSLSELADAAGVSHDDLVAAIASDLPPSSGDGLDVGAVAEQISGATDSTTVDGTGGTTPTTPAGPVQRFTIDDGSGPRTVDASLTTTADLLGTTAADLMSQLSSGSTLSDLADAAGVTHADLVTTIAPDLAAGTTGDATTVADLVASSADSSTVTPDRTPDAGGGTGTLRQFTVDDGGGPQTLSLSLTHTADLLSSTTSDLASWLSDGNSLEDLASALGVTHDDLVSAITADLPSDATGDLGVLAAQVAAATDSTSAS